VSGWPDWQPQPAEVDRILRLSLRDFMTEDPLGPLVIERGPLQFLAPRLAVDDYSVWGATAVILGELRGRLHRLAERATATS
jgi:hypothetical protein